MSATRLRRQGRSWCVGSQAWTSSRVPDEYVAASTKVLGADQVTEFESQVRSMYDQMARISIEPVWARFFDFGAGRMPSFLTKLAGDA
jgi:hypothetical protein